MQNDGDGVAIGKQLLPSDDRPMTALIGFPVDLSCIGADLMATIEVQKINNDPRSLAHDQTELTK